MADDVRGRGVVRWMVPAATVLVPTGSMVALLFVPGIDSSESVMELLAVLLFAGGLVLGSANIVGAVVVHVRKRAGWLPFMRRAMLLTKLGLIPLYLVGALAVMLFGVMSVLPFGILLPFTVIGPLVTFGWVLMACCSAWTISYAIGMARAGRLSQGECVAYTVLSLFFVADVAVAVVLFIRGRTRECARQETAPCFDESAEDTLWSR